MFPHRAARRGRGSHHYNGMYDSPPVTQFYEFNHQGLTPINSIHVPGLDRHLPYQWKPPPATFTGPPSHTPSEVNTRKRQRDDYNQHAVKRQRLDGPANPAVGVSVNRAPPPPHHPDPAVPESSRSFPNRFDKSQSDNSQSDNSQSDNSRSDSSQSGSLLHFPPHPPAVPDASTGLQAYANDKLSDQMVKLFEACQQQSADLDRKESCRFQLQKDIRHVFSVARLYLTGSSMNGLGCRSSDADLCLVIRSTKRPDAIHVLSQLQKMFRSLSYVEKTQLIRAKVPILKFREKGSDLEFDLNVNNTVGIRNTFLLRSYAYADLRIRPLILVIKKWAQHSRINDASKGTLSSYTLALMVLHYLQTLREPVLPSLQRDFPECFSSLVDLDHVLENSKRVPPYCSRNPAPLGELFLGFLRYYTMDFRWDKQVISIREARAFPKANVHEWRNKFICVEEPFERINVARAVHEKHKFDAIRVQFTESWRKLQQSRDLNSILPLRTIMDRESNWR